MQLLEEIASPVTNVPVNESSNVECHSQEPLYSDIGMSQMTDIGKENQVFTNVSKYCIRNYQITVMQGIFPTDQMYEKCQIDYT